MALDTIRITSFAVIACSVLTACPPRSSPPPTRPDPAPRFTAFDVGPSPLCLNIGIPLVRVAYSFDPDGWSNPNTLCVAVLVNDLAPYPTTVHKCLSDGTSHELTFQPSQVFGANVPSTMTVTGYLKSLYAQNQNAFDTQARTVTTIVDCPPAGGVPTP